MAPVNFALRSPAKTTLHFRNSGNRRRDIGGPHELKEKI
jgi:hypothetical protein